MMSALASLGSAIGSRAWRATVGYIHPPKVTSGLDPIHTICMLAMRGLGEYQGSLPAVRNNALELDKKWMGQGAVRAIYDASFNDLEFVSKNIRFFKRGWQASKNPELVEIATFAIRGIKSLQKLYEERNEPGGANLCKVCKYKLEHWVKQAAENQQPVAPEKPERKPLPFPPADLEAAIDLSTRLKESDFRQNPGLGVFDRMIEQAKPKRKEPPEEEGSPKPQKMAKTLDSEGNAFVVRINDLWMGADKGADSALTRFLKDWKHEPMLVGQLKGTLEDQKKFYLQSLEPKV